MEFKLPDIGEGVQEGELIRWLVKDGDTVAADQPVLEVMTDKATVEVPAPVAGVIKGISGKEGQMIKVGQVLAQIEGGAAAAPSKPATPPPPPAQAVAPAPAATNGQHGAGATSGGNLSPSFAASLASATAAPASTKVASAETPYLGALEAHSPSNVPAAPIVRAMAAKAGVDLGQVPASGAAVGGTARVLEEDLVRYLSGSSPTASAPQAPAAAVAPRAGTALPPPPKAAKPVLPLPTRSFGPTSADERQPVRGLRRVIAQAMVRSKYTAPHYSYVDKFECTELVAVRERAKEIGEKYGVKVTYLPFVVKAVVGALREFPIVNTSLEEKDGQMELVYKKGFHIGFAVATNDGLVVPVIKNADQKSLLQIAHEMAELSAKVRAGKATGEDLKGSTFSITSMGNIGGMFATPIINYPEVGILGVYKVADEPIVKDGQIVVGKTMHLSLSLDHRVVDGAVGGHFCNAIIERLADPARLLLEMV